MPIYPHEEYLKITKRLPDYTEYDQNGIPFVEADDLDISGLNNSLWLINISNVNEKAKNVDRKIVHCHRFDDKLDWIEKHPLDFIDKVFGYYAVCTPDISMDKDMKIEPIRSATFRNRWTGVLLQANGSKVITTVGWVTKETFDICLSGLRNGGTFMISTLGVNNDECRNDFLAGYNEMRKRYPDSKIICLGDRVKGMDSDVYYVKYEDAFGNWEKYRKNFQTSLFNYDFSIPDKACEIEF